MYTLKLFGYYQYFITVWIKWEGELTFLPGFRDMEIYSLYIVACQAHPALVKQV